MDILTATVGQAKVENRNSLNEPRFRATILDERRVSSMGVMEDGALGRP